MTTQEIVAKLWNLCNVLRDDGITYQDYVTELTYILFLKMADETGAEEHIPEPYRWATLRDLKGIHLLKHYTTILEELGGKNDKQKNEAEADREEKPHDIHHIIKAIYREAKTSIREPNNLEKIIKSIDELDWFSAREEGLGDLYEGLLEKNANEKKSGAGQYFTPRPLIDVMTELVRPQAGELCNDPACGTFGFMISAFRYVRAHTNRFKNLDAETAKFEINEAFTGCELVPETRRLALMNELLHGISGRIALGDTLSSFGKQFHGYDVVLTNPPFGTKKGGETSMRDDFTFTSSNKQLNVLQHIYRSLKKDGKARAAVVLPDNVLFADGDGASIRRDLMDKCNLHTILRLPTGIFYAQGVKTNVLFFTRGTEDSGNTKEVWFYDLRTNMPSFGKTNPLKKESFADFMTAYTAQDRHVVTDERWSVCTREEIAAKGDSLDLGLIRDESVVNYEDLPDPVESCEDSLAQLGEAMDLIKGVMERLKSLQKQG